MQRERNGYERTELPRQRRDVDVGELIADIEREDLQRQVSGAFRGLWFAVKVMAACVVAYWIGHQVALMFYGSQV